jgi:hypothetical protein
MRALAVCLVTAVVLAGCSRGDAGKGQAPASSKLLTDASAPGSCRAWAIQMATLQCAGAVMRDTDATGDAKRIAASEAKLSRYGELGADLCREPGAASSDAEQAARAAISEASTRVQIDKVSAPSMIMKLCLDAASKQVARAQEDGSGRKDLAELKPGHQDDAAPVQGD